MSQAIVAFQMFPNMPNTKWRCELKTHYSCGSSPPESILNEQYLKRKRRTNQALITTAADGNRERTIRTQAMDNYDHYSSSSSSRPLANFPSTFWGYNFLSYTSQQTEITAQEKLEVDQLKEMMRKMLVETPENSPQKLVLIDTIQRLGVAYHFHNEIETSIQNIVDAQNNDNNHLYVVSLRFRLMRQQGHYMSSDVFKQFTEPDGKFKKTLTNDVQGLLSLYEASHLRVRNEEILEEALTFTTNQWRI